MSVAEAQREITSAEFTEWMAFYTLEAELSGAVEHEPTPEELGGKLSAWAAMQNAREHGKVTRERR